MEGSLIFEEDGLKYKKTDRQRVECYDVVKNQGYQTSISLYMVMNFWILWKHAEIFGQVLIFSHKVLVIKDFCWKSTRKLLDFWETVYSWGNWWITQFCLASWNWEMYCKSNSVTPEYRWNYTYPSLLDRPGCSADYVPSVCALDLIKMSASKSSRHTRN